MPTPVKVTVTGAAGQIGYALLFRIASGQMLGPDQVEVWAPTQDADTALATAADAAGVPPERVILHRTMLGAASGGAGRSRISCARLW